MSAFRAARLPMLLADARQDGQPIVFVNDAFLGLTGYDRGEVLGGSVGLLLAGGGAAAARLDRAMAEGRGAEVDLDLRLKDGSTVRSRVSLSAVHDDAGRLRHFFLAVAERGSVRQAAARRDVEANRTRISELEAALAEKTQLLHEVDHRVKNNLQTVSSLMLLKARRVRSKAVRQALLDMAERVGALAAVHRLMYAEGERSTFDVTAFITDIAGDLMAGTTPGQIDLKLVLAPLETPLAKAAPLALLLNELLTNALRHAFPRGRKGRLTVATERRAEGGRIIVEDDGVGMGQEMPAEAFGRSLAEMLARQIGATLTWEDAAPGTRVTVLLPPMAAAPT